jgi:hypothetical protein
MFMREYILKSDYTCCVPLSFQLRVTEEETHARFFN